MTAFIYKIEWFWHECRLYSIQAWSLPRPQWVTWPIAYVTVNVIDCYYNFRNRIKERMTSKIHGKYGQVEKVPGQKHPYILKEFTQLLKDDPKCRPIFCHCIQWWRQTNVFLMYAVILCWHALVMVNIMHIISYLLWRLKTIRIFSAFLFWRVFLKLVKNIPDRQTGLSIFLKLTPKDHNDNLSSLLRVSFPTWLLIASEIQIYCELFFCYWHDFIQIVFIS